MKIPVGALLFLALLAAAPEAVSAADRIQVGRQLTDPQTADAAAAAAGLAEKVASLANRLFADSISVLPASAKDTPDYILSFVMTLGGENPATVLTLSRAADENASASYTYLGTLTPEVPSILARSVFLLWSSLRHTLDARVQAAPVFADEIPTELFAANSTPMSLAVLSDGSLVAALAVSCVQLDHAFRVVNRLGASLYDAGLYAFAYGVSATPGGTVYLKPGMGRDAYRISALAREGSAQLPAAQAAPQRVGLGQELTMASLTALPDGSLFLLDSVNKQALRIQGRRKTAFPVFSTKYSYINAVAAAPDGSLWFYDQLMKGIRIFTLEGTPVDSLLPLVDAPLSPTSMSVGPDGSFVLLSSGELSKFRRDGSLAWRLTSFEGADQPALPSSGAVAVDWTRGLIYVADMTGRRIVKLIDRTYCAEKDITNTLELRVIALRERRAADETGSLVETAKVYEAGGSTQMARSYWMRVQDADPGNETAAARLSAIEVEELKRAARELDGKARATLAGIGIESARPLSVQAIQKYELILSKAPGDTETRRAMGDLKKLFGPDAAGAAPGASIGITDVRISNLFPSLMEWYATHPAGAVTLSNTGHEPLRKVRASIFIPDFMRYPRETAPRDLAAGESATLDLSPLFTVDVLGLQEDMTVAAQVVVTFSAGGAEQSAARTVLATIYRNTALSWDDTRKISSYITPNEETISGFAARALAERETKESLALPRKIVQAMRICDTLGVYGITYVEDPDSPFSRALGRSEVVDTVRFPRVTLYNRTGDCDDTTALLASLLESQGIHTAVLTTPGHIFLAFDSGQPPENARYIASDTLEVIVRQDTCWVPLETTALSKGFLAAWETGSTLVKKNAKGGPFEFIPLADMRDTYPALPLGKSSVAVLDPLKTDVDRALASSFKGIGSALYEQKMKGLEARLATLSGSAAVKVRIQKGVLQAFFGSFPGAEETFRVIMADDPGLVSPYVNLANIRLLSNDRAGALKIVRQGLERNADAALLNLLAARIYADSNDAANVALYYSRLKKQAPDLAAHYPELAAGGAGGAQRAAQAGGASPLIWSDQ